MAHHGGGTEELEVGHEERLLLIKSPVVGESQIGSHASSIEPSNHANMESLGFGDRIGHITPEFLRHEEATNVELFFDLFFAANLTVFSEVHEVTNPDQLTSYVGYFTILWFTWALVGLFDVRFVTDSVFERVARACHQGVMIGFAVVAPNFKPAEQNKKTFQAMSIILVVSRLVLAIQYFSVLWQVRSYKRTKLPLGIMVATHVVAAIVYLGATFGFRDFNTNVYYIWYIIGAFEIAISVVLSLVWNVISFQKTHLNQRMSLLTLIIIGEGIIVLSHNITTIVSNPGAWTSATIGVVTAGVTTIYMVYQLYFDFMCGTKLGPIRQILWVFFHYPVHLALTLFMEGASQFVLWWKVVEVFKYFEELLTDVLNEPMDTCADLNHLSQCVADYLKTSVDDIFALYTPQYTLTTNDISTIFKEMSELSNEELQTPKFTVLGQELYATVANSVLATFKIDAFAELESLDGMTSTEWELEAFRESFARYDLVVAYAFVSSGMVLMLLTLLFAIQRTKKWTPASIVHLTLNFLLGFGLVLVSLLRLNFDRIFAYETSPYILPTICLVYTFVVISNHLPGPSSRFYRPWLWRAALSGQPRGDYAPSFNKDPGQYNLPAGGIPQSYEGNSVNTANDASIPMTQNYAPVVYDGGNGYAGGSGNVPAGQVYTQGVYDGSGEYAGGGYNVPSTQPYAPGAYEGGGGYVGGSYSVPATQMYTPQAQDGAGVYAGPNHSAQGTNTYPTA